MVCAGSRAGRAGNGCQGEGEGGGEGGVECGPSGEVSASGMLQSRILSRSTYSTFPIDSCHR